MVVPCIFFTFSFFLHHFSFKIPDVTERLRQNSEGRTRASKLIFTVWAVFGGFILHFLLSNYLTVLLRPSYEVPVETAADLIKRDITPFVWAGGQIYRQILAAYSDPVYQELSRRLVIADDWDHFFEMTKKLISTGLYAQIRNVPYDPYDIYTKEGFKYWYKSSEAIGHIYSVHLANKKWPLKKVR